MAIAITMPAAATRLLTKTSGGPVSAAAFGGVGALLMAAPFESLTPVLSVPGQSLSSSELVLVAVLSVWAVSALAVPGANRQIVWRTSLTLPAFATLVTMAVGALASGAHRGNALHMVGRFGLAFAVYLLAVNALSSARRLRQFVCMALIAGVVLSLLLVVDFAGVGVVRDGLRVFRSQVALVGDQVRASGPFAYPTIASMYLEVLFALALGGVWIAADARGSVRLAAALLGTTAISEAVVLTFTRAGLITMAFSVVTVAAARVRARGVDRGAGALVAAGFVLLAQIGLSRSAEAISLRFSAETQERWYQAAFEVPPQLTVQAGATIVVPVEVVNTGLVTWDPGGARPFRVSYHWLSGRGEGIVSWEGVRTTLPGRVASGERVSLEARIEAPRTPGMYRLQWDVEQQDRLWFSIEPGAHLFTSDVVVTPSEGSGTALSPAAAVRPLPGHVVRPGRLALWAAALEMLRARPLLGVGPDNFRLLYGTYAGIDGADARVHSNSLYLELLVGGGLLGGLACMWLLAAVLRHARACLGRARTGSLGGPAAAILAALGTILLHGLVDSFLGFTATYTIIAMVVGAVVVCRRIGDDPGGRAWPGAR